MAQCPSIRFYKPQRATRDFFGGERVLNETSRSQEVQDDVVWKKKSSRGSPGGAGHEGSTLPRSILCETHLSLDNVSSDLFTTELDIHSRPSRHGESSYPDHHTNASPAQKFQYDYVDEETGFQFSRFRGEVDISEPILPDGAPKRLAPSLRCTSLSSDSLKDSIRGTDSLGTWSSDKDDYGSNWRRLETGDRPDIKLPRCNPEDLDSQKDSSM